MRLEWDFFVFIVWQISSLLSVRKLKKKKDLLRVVFVMVAT
jgi:hypothetical protein